MITEDYVSFEVAKLLKEKGFDESCEGFYVNSGVLSHTLSNANNSKWDEDKSTVGYISAPTLQLATKWLREVQHIFIDIDYDSHEFGDKPYFTLITNMDTCSYYSGKNLPLNRATYEEMAEAAIKYCLENLI